MQTAVLNYLARLELQGKLMFWRQNNTGIWDARRQCYRKPSGAGARQGVPDIVCVLRGGTFLGIECKAPNGTQSPPQRGFERDCQRLGARYAVVRSLDEAVALINACTADNG